MTKVCIQYHYTGAKYKSRLQFAPRNCLITTHALTLGKTFGVADWKRPLSNTGHTFCLSLSDKRGVTDATWSLHAFEFRTRVGERPNESRRMGFIDMSLSLRCPTKRMKV